MHLKAILNHVEKQKGFVYHNVCFAEGRSEILVSIQPHGRSRAICSGCGRKGPGYDRLAERRFEFVPLWVVMTMTHELGHILGGWIGGGTLTDIDLAPWRLPNSLHSPNPINEKVSGKTPGQTGLELRMKESYEKGLANRSASNPTLATVTSRVWHGREVHAGQESSSEIIPLACPHCPDGGRQHGSRRQRT